MTLGRFAIAVGADPKWVLNAAAGLDRSLEYSEAEARRLGLAKRIQEALDLSLKRADALAGEVVQHPFLPTTIVEFAHGDIKIAIDLERYLSDFAVRLSGARTHYAPRRRGRRPKDSPLTAERAREYGIDVDLVRANLRLTPAERLQRLDRDREFVADLTRGHSQTTSSS